MGFWLKISKVTTRWDWLSVIASIQFIALRKNINNFSTNTLVIMLGSLFLWLVLLVMSAQRSCAKSDGEIGINSSSRNILVYIITTGLLVYSVGFTPGLIIGVYLIFCLVSIVYIFANIFRKKRVNIEIKESDYRAGFYWNTENENLTVPRWKYGVGVTVNFTRPEAWLIVIIALFAPLLAHVVSK